MTGVAQRRVNQFASAVLRRRLESLQLHLLATSRRTDEMLIFLFLSSVLTFKCIVL